MLHMKDIVTTSSLCVGLCTGARADLVAFWDDVEGWQSAVVDHQVIDFTQYAPGTMITDQYDGFDVGNLAFIHNAAGFTDGHGLTGSEGIHLFFETPIHALGLDHLGAVAFALYIEGDLIGIAPNCDSCPVSGWFSYGGGVHFSGVLSDVPFDEVYMFRPNPPFDQNVISMDNLYWGTIPAPGTLAFLGIAALCWRRKRR